MAAVAVGAALAVALAPLALGVGAVILVGMAAGATFGFLNEGLNHGFGCPSCLLMSTLKGAVVGGLAAIPFVFAGPGVAALAAAGAASGAISYTADWALSGADPSQWSWKGFLASTALGGVVGSIGGKIGGSGGFGGVKVPGPLMATPEGLLVASQATLVPAVSAGTAAAAGAGVAASTGAATMMMSSGSGGGGSGDDPASKSGEGSTERDVEHSRAAEESASAEARAKVEAKVFTDNKTVSSDGAKTVSGWSKTPEGYSQATPEQVKEYSDQIGHELRPAGAHDQVNRGGFVGKYNASHAEKQMAVVKPGEPIGVSKPMCSDCRAFFRAHAAHTQQPQYVTDPEMTRIFHPDGTITEIPRPR